MIKAVPSNPGQSVVARKASAVPAGYGDVRSGIVELLNAARQAAARSVNALMTASYWEIGRRIVQAEQKGKRRARYGEQLIERLSLELTKRLTLSGEFSEAQTQLQQLSLPELAQAFPLPWSAYVRLLSVKDKHARQFYETEALRGGWSVRQLDRQIGSQFYERTALSKNKVAMLTKGAVANPEDAVTPDEAVKDPFVLEFGSDFTFVGRQRRLRLDSTWYRVDLLLSHRRLGCLVIISCAPTKAMPWRAMRWMVCPTKSWQPTTKRYCHKPSCCNKSLKRPGFCWSHGANRDYYDAFSVSRTKAPITPENVLTA